MKYRVSLDDIFEDGLWDALNKGSNSGHHIEVEDPTPEKEIAVLRMMEKFNDSLFKLLLDRIEVVPEDDDDAS